MKGFVIISAERDYRSKAANKVSTDLLRTWLTEQNYAFKEVDGCYKGTIETSFVVLAPTRDEISNLVCQAKEYSQECILAVNNLSEAFLVNGDIYTSIGRFTALEGLPEDDSWTFDHQTGTYYEVS